MSLGIELPRQFTPLSGDFELTPANIQHFIDQLPLADAVESNRTILDVLRETNDLAYPAPVRLAFLVALKAPLKEIGQQLAERLASEQFPLSHNAIAVARQIMQTQRELAVAYLYAAEDLGGQRKRSTAELAFAVLNALRYFGLMLLTAYQARLPHILDGWRACHRLYRYAERERIHDFRPSGSQSDIAQAYKRVLLLGACDPSRFRQQELTAVYNLFDRHSAGVDLLPPELAPARDATLFVVNLDADNAPVRHDFRRSRTLKDFHRLLWVDPLCENLLAERDPQLVGVARAVTEHWRRTPNRKERLAVQHPFELLIGFSAIHRHLLAHSGSPLAEQFPVARFDDEGEGGSDGSQPLAAQRWFSCDLSDRGVRLSRSLDLELMGLQVGVPVAIRLADTDLSFRVGCVRWFRNTLDGSLEMGVELLGLEPRAIAVEAEGMPPQPALEMAGINDEEAEIRDRIMVPGRGFPALQEVRLHDGEGARDTALARLLERTPSYGLFQTGAADPG